MSEAEALATSSERDYAKQAYTKMAYFALRPELHFDGGEPPKLTRRQRFRRWRRDLPRPYFMFCRPSHRWDDYGDY